MQANCLCCHFDSFPHRLHCARSHPESLLQDECLTIVSSNSQINLINVFKPFRPHCAAPIPCAIAHCQ